MVESTTKKAEHVKVPEGYAFIQEGQARILYIESKLTPDEQNMVKPTGRGKREANDVNENRGAVFYNPIQEFNRDFSIMAISQYAELVQKERTKKNKTFEGVTILEALAATGLRSVRYSKEIPLIKSIVANDLDKTAVDLMQKNFEFNQLPSEKYEVHCADAIDLMHGMRRDKRFFNVVDLDPYGTAIPFLESAISCMANGGLLAVTCTDMAVLCARQPHVCFYKYGAAPLGKSYCHEQALRMLLYCISTMANKHGREIEPMVSLTVDFYVRCFIRIKDSPSGCQKSISRYSHINQCTACETFYLQKMGQHTHQVVTKDSNDDEHNKKRREKKAIKKINETVKEVVLENFKCSRIETPRECGTCGSPLMIGGPIWNQPIHNLEFVRSLYEKTKNDEIKKKFGTIGRIQGILGGIIDESNLQDQPLSYDLQQICSNLKMTNLPKPQLIAGFNSLGFQMYQTYYDPKLWKTDCPPELIYDTLLAYKKIQCERDGIDLFKNVNKQSTWHKVLSREPPKDFNPDFTPPTKAEQEDESNKKGEGKLLRKYFTPTEKNWGPKARATGVLKQPEKK